ncbi:MAG: endopeptidase La [Ruminococcaceae bacterium]|nr:endopeptidase La [Oscillospiraceae bacterium]
MEEIKTEIYRDETEKIEMPMLVLRGICAFPETLLAIEVERPASVAAIRIAEQKNDKLIFLAMQKNYGQDSPASNEIYQIGTVCRISECISFSNGRIRLVAKGLYRARRVGVTSELPCYTVFVTPMPVTGSEYASTMEFQAKRQLIIDDVTGFRAMVHNGDTSARRLSSYTDGQEFCFNACNLVEIPQNKKQQLLEETELEKRIDLLLEYVKLQFDLTVTMNEVNMKVQDNFNKQQREALIREEIKVLKEELGEGEQDEIDRYREMLEACNLPEESRRKIEKDISRLEGMNPMMADTQVTKNYLDLVFDLPWSVFTEDSKDIVKAEEVLERDHFGLKKVKERILEYLAVKCHREGGKDPILCLYGPPGTGKTSVVRSMAEAMNKKYVRMSLGGVHDEAEIRGHRKTYVGAMPGRIISAIKQAGSCNPIILLDEIDKLGKDMRGDPGAALLEVLDGEQNFSFRDHYLEIPFDLSNVTFITTANDLEAVPGPLRDRMEIIEINGYTEEEKLEIAKRHLIPKQLKENGMKPASFKISDKVIKSLIWNYTAESGVRQLERAIGAIVRKSLLKITKEEKKSITITGKLLEEFMGPSKRYDEDYDKVDKVGVAGGLAWTQVGGVTMSIEVNIFPGTGKMELTGSLGDVMKESAKTALSYIRSRAKELGVSETFYKDTDIHIHVPEGATPKDGPSAGITMATALVSAFTGKPVRHDVAMTGEVTLRGNVLPIGGLKEKSLAALRKGVTTIIIPEANRRDAEEIPEAVKDKIKIVYAKNMEQVLNVALR